MMVTLSTVNFFTSLIRKRSYYNSALATTWSNVPLGLFGYIQLSLHLEVLVETRQYLKTDTIDVNHS